MKPESCIVIVPLSGEFCTRLGSRLLRIRLLQFRQLPTCRSDNTRSTVDLIMLDIIPVQLYSSAAALELLESTSELLE